MPASLLIRPSVAYAVLLMALAAVLVHCSACVQAVKPPRAAVVSRELAATVYVGSVCGSQVTGATGVLVSSERAYTALHVIRCDHPTIVIRTVAGEVRPASLLLFWPDQDLALLRVETPAPPTKGVGLVRVGDVVCLSSAVPARERSCGVVTAVRSDGDIYHTARVLPGNSGSGLYDAKGALVGVVTHTLPSGGGIAIRVPERIP